MASSLETEIAHKFMFFTVYKDGHIVLTTPPIEKIPPSESDPTTGVRSKDVVVSSNPNFSVSARIFLPKSLQPGRKLPVLLYFHGGTFCMESPFSTTFHNFVSTVVSAVDDGLFPDRPIPACYDDSWAASQWVSAHKDYDDAMWMYMCPENEGLYDRRIRPTAEDLGRVGCEKLLVFVAEKDHLYEAGKRYVEELGKSGWGGSVEMVERKPWEKLTVFICLNPTLIRLLTWSTNLFLLLNTNRAMR
ncbi:hypothetical protein G4B88_011438 [Cannabis sativa]|uniref:Alpha/beta hydrolase fold-3 domain-containing protein n=1 Tax=Cannabis sativa TaxID=3483 RepID=A0A7J6GHS6_CANSA|nr:hypothetical protein G4B88_011438 [Cannabis sativa]